MAASDDPAQRQKLLRLFRIADGDGNGSISKDELREVLCTLDPSWTAPGKLESMFTAIDANRDEQIDIVEFIEWMAGRNPDVLRVVDEKSHDTLRLTGCTAKSYEQLWFCLAAFGTLRHLHHVQGVATESIAMFATQTDAKAAFDAFAASAETPTFSQEGNGSHQRWAGKAEGCTGICFDADGPGSVHWTSSVVRTEKASSMTPPSFFRELKSAVNRLRLDGDTSWKRRAAHAYQRADTVPKAAALLRGLSLAILEFHPDMEEPLENWQKTMRAVSKGYLDFKDSERITDALRELSTFAHTSPGEVRVSYKDQKVKMVLPLVSKTPSDRIKVGGA